MAGEDEDITIDLRLRDYLTGGAATAAHEMEELADSTKKAARALLLLDKRADKAANSLLKLAAASKAARAAMNDHTTSITDLNKSMSANIQTQKGLEKSMLRTNKAQKDAVKQTKVLHKVWTAFTRVLRLAGPALAMVAKGLALIGAGAMIGQAAQGLLAVSGALSTLLAFAALVPTALGAIVAIGLTLKTVFSGIKPLLEKQFAPIFKLYKDMKKELQKEFLGSLSKEVPAAMRNMFPVIRSGMSSIVKETAGLTNQIAAFFNTNRGRQMFQRFFMAGNQVIRAFQKGIGPLLIGLSDVVESVAPVWDRLMKAFGNGISNFGRWLSKISSDGSLEQWLDTAFVVAKNLFNILGQVGSIISGIIKAAGGAAGGAGLLGAFGNALGEVAKWVNGLEGQTALQSFFQSLGTIVKAVMPILATIANIIGTVLAPALANIVTNLAPYVNQFFQALGVALQTLAPYLPPIAAAFGQLLVALIPLLGPLTTLVQIVLQNLANVLPMLVPLISMFAQAFSAILGPALQVILPLIQQLMPYIQMFFQVFMAALAPLIPQLQLLGQMFAQMLNQHLQRLVGMLPTLIPLLMQLAFQFGTFLLNALTMLMPYMPQIITLMFQIMGVSLQLAPVILAIALAFLRVINAATPIAALFMKIFGVGLTMASGFVAIASMIIGAMSRAASGVAGAVSTIAGLLGRLRSLAGTLAGPFISAAGAISGAIGGISGAISGAIGAIGNLISKARALSSIDVNPFRFAGGDVKAGTKYTVGEIGPELYVPKAGSPQMIGTGGIESRSFNNDGFIVPSFMLGAFKSLERGLESVGNDDPGVSAREMAAIAAAAGGTKHEHYYDIDVIIQGNVREEVDIERAVKRAIDKAERDRKERS